MSDVTLRYYQKDAYPAIVKYLSENEGHHPLLAYPTGAGKTIILSDIVKNALRDYDEHVLVLSHVKEILEQDHQALTNYLKMPIGLYSSGMNSNSREQVTVAGIQSMYNKHELFERYKIITVDECHLIPPKGDGMYQKFFKEIGDHTRIGLTATPYRLGTGYIYGPDAMFDDLIVDYTYMEKFNELIEKGYLCDLRTFPTKVEMDVSGVRTIAGDFSDKDLSEQFDREEITKAIVKEIINVGKNFNKALIFAIDIDHAEHIAEVLLQSGETAYVVHSKMGDKNRDNVVKMFKDGRIRYLVNVNILTTGFDAPDIDLICLLRPTKSPVLHVQSIGRGLRVHPSKTYTMVLDFAGNTERLGPINNITIRKKRESKEKQDPVTKRCPQCNMIHAPAVRVCINCGWEFKFNVDLRLRSTDASIIARHKVNVHDVDDVYYKVSEKPGRPNLLRVTYQCGLRQFVENVCIEHGGYAGHKAKHWAMVRLPDEILTIDFMTANELYAINHLLKRPKQIEVSEGGKYANILKYVF